MNMVLLSDAIEVITDPANLSSFGGAGVRAVNRGLAMKKLEDLDSASSDEARRLGREAVLRIGGSIEPCFRRGGLRAGRPRQHHFEVWWVPTSVVVRRGAGIA
jgi:hypothetical protein